MILKKILNLLPYLLSLFGIIHLLILPRLKPDDNHINTYESIPSLYFSKYHPSIEYGFKKPEAKSMEILINKSVMSIDDMNKIKKQLIHNEWRLIKDSEYYFEFCYGSNNRLSILYPTQITEYSASGYKFTTDDINKWVIEIVYIISGIDECAAKMQ